MWGWRNDAGPGQTGRNWGMLKGAIPAIDAALTPRQGVTRLGQPMSYNRAPACDLAPWLGRLYVTAVDLPDDYRLDCTLLNDVAVIRVQLSGQWRAKTCRGDMEMGKSALLFGPQLNAMPISVTGSFISIGCAVRPGTGTTMGWASAANIIDRLFHLDDVGLPGSAMLARLDPEADAEDWLLVIEDVLRAEVARRKMGPPDPITTRFEVLAYRDPNARIEDFAKECGIGLRQLERIIRRDFGMSPKQVMRRARALDMAAHLRGVADQAEAADIMLRYYDQSHLIRDFTKLFGMSPRQFVQRPLPLMTLTLENRQARRLEAIHRIEPGAARPWE
jgi:AraC-like DNA-binding protein